MRPPFFRDSTLVIVAGKGGVGKTTVSAVTATAAAAAGVRTLLVSLDSDGTTGLQFMVDQDALRTDAGLTVADRIDVRVLLADRALHEWLSDKRMGRLADRLATSGALDMIATAVPGIHDILILGRIKAIVNEGQYDLVVVDGPASGHAVTMLHTAEGLQRSVGVGAIRQQADSVAAMLSDPTMTQVVLVTLAEMTPVTETVETAFALEDRVGVRLGPIVVNQVEETRASDLDPLSVPENCRRLVSDRAERERTQRQEIQRLRALLPLDVIELPAIHGSDTRTRRETLARHLAER
jgi:hypothetical protein